MRPRRQASKTRLDAPDRETTRARTARARARPFVQENNTRADPRDGLLEAPLGTAADRPTVRGVGQARILWRPGLLRWLRLRTGQLSLRLLPIPVLRLQPRLRLRIRLPVLRLRARILHLAGRLGAWTEFSTNVFRLPKLSRRPDAPRLQSQPRRRVARTEYPERSPMPPVYLVHIMFSYLVFI